MQSTKYAWLVKCCCHFLNEEESAASFCHQLAALLSDMFRNFYLVKSHKIAINSTSTEAREKITTDLESLEFRIFLADLKTIKFYVIKLSTD
jgi:hypothetical protein